MNKTFRFLLLCLLLPATIVAFYLESTLQLTLGGHQIAEIGILAAAFWLAWRWVAFDQTSRWREASKLEPYRFHYRIAQFEDEESLPIKPISLPRNGKTTAYTAESAKERVQLSGRISIPTSLAQVVHALMSLGVIFALTAVMVLIGSKTLGEGVIAILYLLPIGWCTVRWGQIAGVSAALTAALAFDFLFIPPYYTFTIGSLEGWLLLILFFATAILVVGRIQTILTEERERERKATFLYEMVAAIANQATREGIARAIAKQIQQKYLAKGVQVHLAGGWGYQAFIAQEGKEQATVPGEKPNRALTIVSGSAVIGEIDIWQGMIPLPPEDDLMLQTMLSQISAAFDRVRLAEGKPPYPRQKPSFSEGNSLQASR